MIYTLTLNPAIDYIMQIGGLKYGKINRSNSEYIRFGGKGINVSIVLSNLGIKSTALGFVAGFTGEALDEAVKAHGVITDFIRLPCGITRINVKLNCGEETGINAQGPEITQNDILSLYKKLDKLTDGDTLVLAGSLPAFIPKTIYADIMSRLTEKGIRFVVDAEGELLTNTLKFHPFLIKPNLSELEEISEKKLVSQKEIIKAAVNLKNKGALNVLVSLGGDGSILVDEYGNIHTIRTVSGKVINTVGAGDSMIAGFLAGVERGYEYAVLLANAAGSATAFSNELASKQQIMALYEELKKGG